MKLRSNGDLRIQDFANSTYHRPHDNEVEIPVGSVKPWPTYEDGSWDQSEEEPTVSRPSLRRRRAVLSSCVIAFTIGSLLIILSSPYRNEFLAPGPLHSSHAQLLSGQADRCAACHTGSSNSAFGWIAHAFSGASGEQGQSQLCLECHKVSINEQFALNPHSIAPKQLAEKSKRYHRASFLSRIKTSPVNSEYEIACSACHREHKGSEDLKAMTDAQCQSCHRSNFHSFETDHPEFTNKPEASRQKISFDHSTHSSRHFPASGSAFDCNQCHLDDAFQNVKVLAPFEQACASCHEKQIVDSGVDGFPLLSLPMLDMVAIEQQDLDPGSWPLNATGDFDGPIPPAMRLLLMADPDAIRILGSKPASFGFADIDPGNPNDIREVVTLVWSIKRLVHELSTVGSASVTRRLQLALGRELDPQEVKGLLNGMEDHSFAAAARRWFPDIDSEIKGKFGNRDDSDVSMLLSRQQILTKLRSQESLAENPISMTGRVERKAQQSNATGDTAAADRDSTARDATEIPVAAARPDSSGVNRNGWVRDDRLLRILYRPGGHRDPFLKLWIDLVLATPDADTRPATTGLFHSLTKETSIGNCRSCHTLKRLPDGAFVMNWSAAYRDASVNQLTSFSHRPHLVQPVLQDCSHCHRMDSSVSNSESFASLDRTDYRSNFHPIQKAMCTSCHQNGLTDNSCTTCHNYHVGGHKTR